MSVVLSQGTQLAIAATYGAVKAMSALTNAVAGVATLEAAHGIIVGDQFEITSGWDRLSGRVVRASVVATNDVTLEGVDTSSTTLYPAGSGVGTIREILTWASITQIDNVSASQPSVDFVDVTTLADQTKKQIPSLDNFPDLTISVLYDPTLSWVATVLAASLANALSAVRMILPNGSKVYANGYWKISSFPQIATGQAVKNTINLTFNSNATQYAS